MRQSYLAPGIKLEEEIRWKRLGSVCGLCGSWSSPGTDWHGLAVEKCNTKELIDPKHAKMPLGTYVRSPKKKTRH